MRFSDTLFTLASLLTLLVSASPVEDLLPVCRSCFQATDPAPTCEELTGEPSGPSPHQKRAVYLECKQPSSKKNIEKLDRLKQAFTDAKAMASSVLENPHLDSIYDKYFSSRIPHDDVLEVFRQIKARPSDVRDNNVVGSIQLYLSDWRSQCKKDPALYAFLAHATAERGEVMAFCPKAYDYPDHKQQSCGGMPAAVGDQMTSLASIMLHELTHSAFISIPALGKRITDYEYDAYHVQKLRKDDPLATRLNADSYTFYAMEVYWSNRCKRTFKDPIRPKTPVESALICCAVM